MPTVSSLVVDMSVEELRSFNQVPAVIRLEVSDCETHEKFKFKFFHKKGKKVICQNSPEGKVGIFLDIG